MTKRLTLEEFIYKAKQVHNNKYDYSNVEYINNTTKIKITCQEHGIFEQSPDKHLQKRGCPKCAQNKKSYTRDGFIELAGNRLCTFYILKCFNNNEIFYKIGITSLTVKERYSRKASMPYTYEIVKIIEDKADIIWDLESSLKTNLISNYQPQIYFEGSLTECYSDLEEILSNIN